jgi:hypothetical protein
MRLIVGIAALGVLVLAGSGPARALTISNIDPKPHTVTVTAGSESKDLTVEPSKDVDADCASGCKVKLENGEQYEFRGDEAVSIEGGVIFIDHSPSMEKADVPDIDPDAAPAPQ